MSTLRLPEEETLAIMQAVQIYIERMREPTGATNVASFGLNDAYQEEKIAMHVWQAETFLSAMRADLEIFAQANKLREDRLQATKLLFATKLIDTKNELEEAQRLVAFKKAELEMLTAQVIKNSESWSLPNKEVKSVHIVRFGLGSGKGSVYKNYINFYLKIDLFIY